MNLHKVTQKQKNSLAADLRLLADKLESRMIVMNIETEIDMFPGKKEEFVFEGWADIDPFKTNLNLTPDVARYRLDITFQPLDQEPKKKKKRKKKKL